MFLAGIDQSLGTVGPFLRRILRGIEIGRPGGAQYIDVGGGIRARGHRPQHLVNVGRIDVLINDNDVLGVVGARRNLGGQRSGLGGVPGITLLNRNGGGPEPPGRFRERENALNSGDPQPFEIGPDSSGTNDAEQQTLLAGGVVRHQRASQNGIAAVAHAFHIDNGRSGFGPSIIPGELPEGTLQTLVAGPHLSFDDDLGAGRQQQPGDIALEYFDGLVDQAAGVVIFRLRLRQRLGADGEQQGIGAVSSGHRECQSAIPVALRLQPGIFSRRPVDEMFAGTLDHLPVGPQVDVAVFQIARNENVPGPQIAAAIERPHFGRGKPGDVTLIARHDILIAWSVVRRDNLGRHLAAEIGPDHIDEFCIRLAGGKSEGCGHALLAGSKKIV